MISSEGLVRRATASLAVRDVQQTIPRSLPNHVSTRLPVLPPVRFLPKTHNVIPHVHVIISLSPSSSCVLTTMVQAIVNGVVVAESSDTAFVEGNHYFPSESIKSVLTISDTT
jgi:hypothetical protein